MRRRYETRSACIREVDPHDVKCCAPEFAANRRNDHKPRGPAGVGLYRLVVTDRCGADRDARSGGLSSSDPGQELLGRGALEHRARRFGDSIGVGQVAE